MHAARAEIVVGPLQKQEKMKLLATKKWATAPRSPFFGFLGGGRRRRPWHPPRQPIGRFTTPALIIAPLSNFGRRICSLAVLISSGIFKRIGSIIGRPIAFRVYEKRINNRRICYSSMHGDRHRDHGSQRGLYAQRFIQGQIAAGVHVHLVVSPWGRRLLRDELGMETIDLESLAGTRDHSSPCTTTTMSAHSWPAVRFCTMAW